MIMDIIQSRDYQQIVQEQIYDTIDFLLAKNQEFAITANSDHTTFNPQLPQAINDTFAQFTTFVLKNYTYTTINLTTETISFEAGFGKENFGSVVTIPLLAIFQILIEDSILYLNPSATIKDILLEENMEIDPQIKSRNMFLKNNKNLFK